MKKPKTQEQMVAAERRRMQKLLSGVPEAKIKMLAPIIENIAWQRVKLDDARDKIAGTSIVVAYNNGGGQRGVHENPAFKGYEALWKSYMQGMDKILAAMPEEAAEAAVKPEAMPERPQTVLELVRKRKETSA